LPLVQNCLDRDPEIAPDTIDESFGALVERDVKYAKRVVFAAHQKFGIELDSRVVLADGNVRNLAWRICNAKQVVVRTLFITFSLPPLHHVLLQASEALMAANHLLRHLTV